MNVHFYLQKPNNEKSLILMIVSWDSNRVSMSTRINIQTKLWNPEKELVKNSSINSMEINTILTNLITMVKNLYFEFTTSKKELKAETLKSHVIDYFKPKKKTESPKSLSLFQYFDEFIDIRSKSASFQPRTIQRYKTAKNHLISFSTSKKITLDFNSFDANFFDSFTTFLSKDNIKTKRKGLSVNAVGAIIRALKTFLGFAYDQEWTSNNNFRKHLKSWKKEADTVALNFDEVQALEKVEFTDNESSLERVRNLFLLLIFTGIRYSDLENLSAENIDLENQVIRINVIKTTEALTIPISTALRRVLDKFPGFTFKVLSNQKFNQNVKLVAKKAGIDTQIKTVKFYGKERRETIEPKYNLISAHTARRTFITLALKMGVLPEMVMKISGHSDRRSFQKYVKISQLESVDAVRDVFNKF